MEAELPIVGLGCTTENTTLTVMVLKNIPLYVGPIEELHQTISLLLASVATIQSVVCFRENHMAIL